MSFGTFTSFDTLATLRNTTVAQFGEDKVFAAIDAELKAHNAILADLGSFIDTTTDMLRAIGGTADMQMEDIDEFGTPDAQKATTGDTVGFPLRNKGIAIQWTYLAFQNMTPAELAEQFTMATKADVKALESAIKKGIFVPTNSTFEDIRVARISLPVKALLNADSAPIPIGPNGEVFDASTHTHYLGTSSFVASDLTALIETVVEHYDIGQAMVYINRAQEAAVRAFTGFAPYTDARIINPTTATVAGGSLLLTNLYNRAIGVYQGAEVWVKPWIPANYVFAWIEGAPVPLVRRIRNAQAGNLRVMAEDEVHPLRARVLAREFGVGVWNRPNGAVLRTNNATYATPAGI